MKTSPKPPYSITKEQQLKELTNRITPIVNVDIVIVRDGTYLVGHKTWKINNEIRSETIFPGGRMRYDEIPQETALRILSTEVPGLQANVRKLVGVISDKGYDHRAYGITLYYLLTYVSGEPQPNQLFSSYEWLDLETMTRRDDVYVRQKALFAEIAQAIQTVNTSEDELLVEVDEHDIPIGSILKRDAHSTPDRYHRTALIVVYDSQGRVVLQQRAANKNASPLKWDIFGGHIQSGFTPEVTATAELHEELGVEAPVTFQFKELYRSSTQAEWRYIYTAESDGPYRPDPHEVAQVQAFDIELLLTGQYDIEYSILPHVKLFVEKLKKTEPASQSPHG